MSLPKTQAAILAAIKRHPGITNGELCQLIDRSESTALESIRKLIDKGLLFRGGRINRPQYFVDEAEAMEASRSLPRSIPRARKPKIDESVYGADGFGRVSSIFEFASRM